MVADRLQDAYIDELWEARPRCPFHQHPLGAELVNGEAVWQCPGSTGWTRPIGHLGTDADYLASIRG